MTEKDEAEFNEKFKDLTHVGCGGNANQIPCHTVKQDVLRFITRKQQELLIGLLAKAESMETAKEVRHLIKEKILDGK